MSRLVFLGPQRFRPTVRDAVASLGGTATVAVVTAGWQERESEDRELQEHLGCEVVDLMVYHRADDVLLRDRELAGALREQQETVAELQRLYRVRLGYMLEAARELLRSPGRTRLLVEQQGAAIRAVRTLDRQHLQRLRRMRRTFDERWQPSTRPAVVRHRKQFEEILGRAGVLAIAGGHVAVLVNRMRLFDLLGLVGERPVIAWSAGAMALAERVILFHDAPPQGPGNTEVFDAGLGFAPDIVPLPHAVRRLRLSDPFRIELFARRFGPDTCVILEDGSRMDWDGKTWSVGAGTRGLSRDGTVVELAAKR